MTWGRRTWWVAAPEPKALRPGQEAREQVLWLLAASERPCPVCLEEGGGEGPAAAQVRPSV